MSFFAKLGETHNKIILVLAVLSLLEGGALGYTKWLESENGIRLDNIERLLSLCGHVAQAETDINSNILKSQGIELYHCNKDRYGHPKFSFVVYKGGYYPARKLTAKGIWEFQDLDETWHPIVNIKEMK